MVLIADSGSTKTDWRLIHKNGSIRRYSTKGINPYFLIPEEISKIISDQLRDGMEFNTVSSVMFYGAGCTDKKQCEQVKEGLTRVFTGSKIKVESDMLGAAKALFANESGIAAILGTGSNSCYYDGKEIVNSIPSLGYVLGDEGGGSYIGKLFLKAYLHGEIPNEISIEFERNFTSDRESILESIYSRPFPNRFLASFCEFIGNFSDNQVIVELVRTAFSDFFEVHISKYQNYQSLPLGVVGSIGFHFNKILDEVASEKNVNIVKIIKSPIEDLVRYHQENL